MAPSLFALAVVDILKIAIARKRRLLDLGNDRTLCMLFPCLPDVELKLGLEVKVGEKVLGTIIGATIFDDGMVLVKLRTDLRALVETPPPRPVEPVNE